MNNCGLSRIPMFKHYTFSQNLKFLPSTNVYGGYNFGYHDITGSYKATFPMCVLTLNETKKDDHIDNNNNNGDDEESDQKAKHVDFIIKEAHHQIIMSADDTKNDGDSKNDSKNDCNGDSTCDSISNSNSTNGIVFDNFDQIWNKISFYRNINDKRVYYYPYNKNKNENDTCYIEKNTKRKEFDIEDKSYLFYCAGTSVYVYNKNKVYDLQSISRMSIVCLCCLYFSL